MTNTLLLFDLSNWSQISVTGPDRASHLHSFCTNNIQALQAGEVCEAFIPDIKGRILGHVIVVAEAEKLSLLTTPGGAEIVVPHLQKYLLGVQADLVDLSSKSGLLCLVGEHASDVLGFETDLAMNRAERLTWEGPALMAIRFDLTNLPTYLIYGERTDIGLLKNQLLSRDIVAGREEEFERLRIEAGFPFVGRDLSENNIAQEAARTEKAISFAKGCYLGQEPIARLDAMGHTNKELRGLYIPSGQVEVGASVNSDEKEIGTISSVAMRPDGATVALAVLRAKSNTPGVNVVVNASAGPQPAQVFWPRLEEI